MANVFELVAKLLLDSSDYDSKLKTAGELAKTVGSGIGTAIKTAGAMVGAATTAVVAFAGESVKTGMTFDSSMSQVAATMGTTVDEIQNLREFALQMGSTTAFSASQAADALNYMALAGYSADEAMTALPNVLNLAAAGGIELARASDMVTDAQSALGLSFEESAVLVDQMAKASSKSNTSVSQLGDAILTVGGTAKNLAGGTTELSTALGLLADNGIKGAEGGTALRNIILSLSAPTDTAAKKMEELGLSAYDADGNLRPLQEIFEDLNGTLSNMTQGEQTEVLNTLFNKVDLKSANALLATTSERWEELSAAIDDADGAAKQMAETQLDNLAGDITLFQSALEGAKIAISDELTPTLRDFVQFGTDAITGISTSYQYFGLEGAATAIGTFLNTALSRILEMLPSFVDAGMQLVSTLGQGIMNNLPEIITIATDIVLSLSEYIIEALPQIVDAGFQVVEQLAVGIAQALPELIPAAVNALLSMQQAFYDNLPLLLDAGLQIVVGLAQGMINAIPDMIAKLPQLIDSLVTFIIGAIPQIIQAGIELLTALVDGLPDIISAIVEALPQIIEGIITALIEGLPLIVQAGIDLLTALVQALPQIITTIVGKLPELINGIIDALLDNLPLLIEAGVTLFVAIIQNLPEIIAGIVEHIPEIIEGILNAFASIGEKMWEVGGNIVRGIWEGIQQLASWLWEQISGWVNGIVDGVKGFLGIQSPSKVFAGIGENMALGIGKGFDESMDAVKNQMDDSLNFENAFSANLRGAGGGTSNSIQINVYGAEGQSEATLAEEIDRVLWDHLNQKDMVYA